MPGEGPSLGARHVDSRDLGGGIGGGPIGGGPIGGGPIFWAGPGDCLCT